MNPLFDKLWLRGYAETNRKNILSLLKEDKAGRFIDLGCDDGSLTIDVANKIDTKSVFGLEKNPGRLTECKKKGVRVMMGDLDKGIPIKSNSFDIVLSNQVIEHVCNTDLLLREIWPFDHGRFEFRVDASSGEIHIIEVNLNCNLWSRKTIAVAARHVGLTHTEHVETIICHSLHRQSLLDVQQVPERAA